MLHISDHRTRETFFSQHNIEGKHIFSCSLRSDCVSCWWWKVSSYRLVHQFQLWVLSWQLVSREISQSLKLLIIQKTHHHLSLRTLNTFQRIMAPRMDARWLELMLDAWQCSVHMLELNYDNNESNNNYGQWSYTCL